MNLRTRTWFLISLLFFLAAAIFWQLGERKFERDRAAREGSQAVGRGAAGAVSNAPVPVPQSVPPKTNATLPVAQKTFSYCLTNTSLSIDQLSRSANAVILRNALIDSSAPRLIDIPAHLQSDGDPGSYVVQSRGPVTEAFRSALRQIGAEVIAYVPNNSYLVRANERMSGQLGALPTVQAVLKWEPYYKIDPSLLELAVTKSALPSNTRLNLLLFPGEREAVLTALTKMEAVVIGEERSPFGWQVTVRPPGDGLTAIARLPGVQVIERFLPRRIANDLSRARVQITTDATDASPNYRGLRGLGVLVNVNDTGVDEVHPDLMGRVTGDFPLTLTDPDGHGTHVAGTIASSGQNDPQIPPKNVPGSPDGADFRGMAPEAEIFALSIDRTFGPDVPDSYLQETPAGAGAFISNNSWGYPGSGTYTLSAASWDAAVRDALPGVTGSQPLLAVFSAGNRGAGGIDAPGTAKNVITVGAIENRRTITNEVRRGVAPNVETNQPWLGMTDSNNEIASFSSVGNVDPGSEGSAGRFKPDVVAPGTFMVSTRSGLWQQPDNSVGIVTDQTSFVRIRAGQTNTYSTFIPENGVRLEIICVPNADTAAGGLPPLPIQVRAGQPPTASDFVQTNRAVVSTTASVPDEWYYSIANTNRTDVFLNVRTSVTLTNDTGNEFEVLQSLNDELGPNYRYESGTSMAAPVVTGMIALMQEYFSKNLQWTNSPALMKALLINGARSVNGDYDFGVTNSVNGQGWGLPSLTNALPVSPSSGGEEGVFTSSTMVWYDQHPDRALVTGQSLTRTVNVSARTQPLRITLVWTDPPGNPAVGIKLVNNLDLVVTNLDTGDVYVGNGIGVGSTFNDPVNGLDTPFDMVNNVENVYLQGSLDFPLSESYSVTVVARSVNVNSVTAHPDGVVQDYALVVSSGNPRNFSAITVSGAALPVVNLAPVVQSVTNGIPLLNQRVGGNSPYLVSTNGITNQWKFFVVTNVIPEGEPNAGSRGSYIAFRTFLPPNLSRSRVAEADIDLYVSVDPGITNLASGAVSSSWRGVGRGGSESIILSNVAGNEFFYAGVKSEDQQAANFGFFAISSSSPFSSRDTNGNLYMRGYPVNVAVPDGDPSAPQAGFVFGFNTEPIVVQNVVVTNELFHERGDNLFGVLEHNLKTSVLNGNRPFFGNAFYIYDDSGSGEFPDDARTDAPGTLRNFVGEDGVGSWQLTMVDSIPFNTGQVNRLEIRLEPRSEDLTNGVGVAVTIRPGRWWRSVVDVPADATNLLVCVSPDQGPVEVYLGRGFEPDRGIYDTFATITPPGDCLSLGRRDVPPLSQGRYFIGVFNPNGFPVDARIKAFVERDLSARTTISYRSYAGAELLDDATTNSLIRVSRDGLVANIDVGVRISHPRVADLVLHLVSPNGTRVLLAENRGGPTGADYGVGTLQTNTTPVSSAGGAAASRSVIGPLETEGTLEINYQNFGIPDRYTVYYEDVLVFDSGLVSGRGTFTVDYGPGTQTNLTVIVNEGDNPNAGTAWEYTAQIVSGYIYTTFTDSTNYARTPIKFGFAPFIDGGQCVSGVNTQRVAVYTNTFQGAPEPEWSSSARATAPNGRRFLGQFANDTVDFNLASLPPHTELIVTYDLLIINSWDGSAINPGYSPDYWDWSVDGSNVLHTTFSNVPEAPYFQRQAYPGQYPIGNFPGRSGAIANDSMGYPRDALYRISSVIPHSSGSVQMRFSGSGLQGVGDESWGIDNFELSIERRQTNSPSCNYYQPEEPMTVQPFGRFLGENAFGDWRLEIWDNRVGGSLTNGSLLAWKMNITFVNTNPPTVTLTNGLAFCSSLQSNETAYFLVNVPIDVAAVTNTIVASQGVSLIYNAAGLPVGQVPPDTAFLTDIPSGNAVLDGGGWNSFDGQGNLFAGDFVPRLRPGRRFYLGVRNEQPVTNAFCLRVDFQNADPNLAPVIHLGSGSGCWTNGATGFAIDYYSFDVSTNALGINFSLTNITAGGDVSLYVKRGFPLPGASTNFAFSANAGAAAGEFIQVADFTGALLPGRWYMAVVYGTNSPSYQVCAQEIPGPVVPLTVNVTNRNVLISTGAVQYYSVVISSNAFQADFRTIAGNSNIDLYISTNALLPLTVTPTNAMYASTNFAAPSGNELIQLSVFNTNSFLTPGNWYIAVVNKATVPVNYSVVVNQYTTNLNYVQLTNGVPYTDRVAPGDLVGYYRYDVRPNALQVVFETFGTNGAVNGDVDIYIRRGFPLPPPGTNWYHFAGTNTPAGNEWVPLSLGNTNALPLPGSYWIAVFAKNPAASVGFRVRATEIRQQEVTRLFNGVLACDVISPVDTNALHSGARFYRFDVGSNAVQVAFETIGITNNVDLYLQRGLPLTNYSLLLPSSTSAGFTNSVNPGAVDESICLLTNSAAVTLQPGTWYVTVVNRDIREAAFCLRASAVELIPLADGFAQCRSIEPADGSSVFGIDYYSFNVPAGSVQAIFETFGASGNVELYVTRGFPLTNCASFDGSITNFALASSNLVTRGETIALSTNTAPVTLAAGIWYVAVVSRETNNLASYCVRATTLNAADFVAVTNGLSICRTLEPGNGAPDSGIDYFVVSVTNTAILASFQTFNADGDVDLFVTREFSFPNFATFDPALTNYPYASMSSGTAPECITIGTNTVPVVLTNGQWYVAVVNRAATNVSYCFLASEFETDLPVALTNAVAQCESVPPTNSVGAIGVKYYSFRVESNALQATFEIYNASGNVDLYVQNGFCFQNRDTFSLATVNASYSSTNSGTNVESICVHDASLPLGLQPGEWNLAVVNRESTDVTFCVRVRQLMDTNIVLLTNRVDYSPTPLIAGGIEYFRYQVSPDALQVNFQILQPGGNVDLFIDPGFCPENFANPSYVSTNTGGSGEWISVAPDSAPVPLTSGQWLIAVTNRELSAVGYTIRVTELFASDVIRLTNAVGFDTTVGGISSMTGLPASYFVYEVSSSAVRAQFEILSPGGNVNLYARRGLPLPGAPGTSVAMASTNVGSSPELILLSTGSGPLVLSPGDWYLGVLNTTTNDVAYTIIATEYTELGTNVAVRGITLVSNIFCLSWSDVLPGVNYYIEGKPNLSTPVWVPVSPTIRAVTNSISWCITLPSPYSFFRIMEGLSPLSSGNPVTFTATGFGTNGLALQWNAPPGTRFVAEYTETLFPPYWQPYPDYITSTNTVYTFVDDGTRTAPLGPTRYYRFFQVP